MELLFKVSAKKAKEDIKDVGDNLKKVGLGSKLAQGGLNLLNKGFKGIGVAIKAAGIGLFIGLLSQLTGMFQQNQKTADTFSRIMIKLRPVFDAVGKVIEFVATVLEKLIDLFTGAIGFIGKLIGVTDGATSASDDFAESLVNQRKKVQLLESELAMLQLQYQREAELMRQIRDDEARTIDERIQANFELGKVLEEQLRHERSIANEFLKLAEMELMVNEDNIELQQKVLDQKVKLAEIDERITSQRSEQLTNLNALEREREAQQKEAAEKRKEQLEKEAELMKELIDLQNQDIKQKKEVAKTINEQLDSATNANQEIIKELKEKLKRELAAHDLNVKNAKENIVLKNEEVKNFKEQNEEIINSDKERADSFQETAETELKRIGQFTDIFGGSIKTMEDVDRLQESSMNNMNKKIKEFADEIGITVDEFYDPDTFLANFTFARNDLLEEVQTLQTDFATARNNILKETEQHGEAIVSITDQQILASEESALKSEKVVQNSATNRKAIIDKITKEIEDAEASLTDTTTTLQEQADDELFLHFETEKEKEIRLATEKYDKLLGLAENNVEQTKLLEEEKAAVLLEINEREEKEKQKIMLKGFFDFRKEMKKQSDLKKKQAEADAKMEKEAGMKTLQMGIGLAKEGTAAYKALASTETIISTYAGATRAFKDVPSPFNFIQAGLIIAAGIKNLSEINKTKVEGAGGSTETITDTITSGGDMGGDVPALPTFGAAGSDIPPVQAFVIETDISNAQALQSELDLQSTL